VSGIAIGESIARDRTRVPPPASAGVKMAHEAYLIPPRARALLSMFDRRPAHHEVLAFPEEP
jgi:hypothetical protein